jgi:hypothetical protein
MKQERLQTIVEAMRARPCQLNEAVKPGDTVTVYAKDGSKMHPARVERVTGDTVVVRIPGSASDGWNWGRLSPEKKFPASQIVPGSWEDNPSRR